MSDIIPEFTKTENAIIDLRSRIDNVLKSDARGAHVDISDLRYMKNYLSFRGKKFVFAYTVQAYIHKKLKMRVQSTYCTALESFVKEVIEKSAARAKKNKRKTVMTQDI
jgi:histone H3/H4